MIFLITFFLNIIMVFYSKFLFFIFFKYKGDLIYWPEISFPSQWWIVY